MTVVDYILNSLGLVITLFIQLKYYSKIINQEFNVYSFSKILFLLFIIFCTAINVYMNDTFTILIFNYLLIFITFYIIFNDDIKKCFIRTLICYIVMCVFDIIFSILVFVSPIDNISQFNDSSLFRFLLSNIICLSVYYVITRKFMIKYINIIVEKFTNTFYVILVLIIVSLSIFLLAYKHTFVEYSLDLYIVNIVLTICILSMLISTLYNNYKVKLVKKEQETILKFMSDYEKLIDENRIKLHEIHNDMLVLKSIKSKNSKKFENLLDDYIEKFSSSGNTYKNIYKLPPGLKGVLYNKIYEMKTNGINVNMLLSDKLILPLEKIVKKDYVNITKIISILLDNAKESSNKSKNKNVFIDFYDNKQEIIMLIENTYYDKPDFNKIYNKNYSTKGNNRGYGLYILKTLINKIDGLELKQYIDEDKFISELIIKKY